MKAIWVEVMIQGRIGKLRLREENLLNAEISLCHSRTTKPEEKTMQCRDVAVASLAQQDQKKITCAMAITLWANHT